MKTFKLFHVVLILIYVTSPSMGQDGSSIRYAGSSFPKENFENLDGKQKMDQPKSLMIHTAHPVCLDSQLNQLEAEFRQKIEEINTRTRKSSQDQNEKIAIIKARERNLAQLLNQTRGEMVGLKTQNMAQLTRIDQLEKKLQILQNTLPTSEAQTKSNNKDNMRNRAHKNNDQVPKLDPTIVL